MKKILIVLLAALLMTGCEQGIEILGGDEGQRQTVADTDICIPIERVRTWNPLLSVDEDVYRVEKLIYEGLFRLDDTLMAELVLAESYSFDETGTQLTIQLKQGVAWHDGEALTARDVAFTIDAYKKTAGSLYYGQASLIRSVKTSGDYSVTLTFADAGDSSLEKLTFPILPEHQYRNLAAFQRAADDFVPVGTGLYEVESVKKGEEIVLKANVLYHGAEKAANTVTFKVTSDHANPVNLFAISDLNMVFLKELSRETLYSNKDVSAVNFTSNEAEILGFNTTHPLLTSPKMRQAIACAVDVNRLLDFIYYNNGVTSDSLYYPGYLGTENAGDVYPVDVEQARTLIRQLGYSDDGGGMFRDETGKLLTLTLTVNNDSQLRMDAAAMIQNHLMQAGIDCRINAVDWETYQLLIAQRGYELFLGGYQFNEAYDLRFLLHSTQFNPAGYANVRADELLDRMERGADRDGKKEVFEQLKSILKEDVPYYCLFYKTYGRMSAWELETEQTPLAWDFYRGSESWRLLKPVDVVDSAE